MGRGAMALAVLLALAACSFFEPREPEDPDPDPGISWQTPYSPATVMSNLGNAMEGRSISLTMACFDTSYAFLPDDADTAEFGGSWDFGDWDYQVEQNTLMNIFAAVETSGLPEDSLVSVELTDVPGLPDPAAPTDSAEIWRDYAIVLAGSGEYGGWESPAEGRTMLLMVEDEYGLWSVALWEDYRPEGYTGERYTWGVVKATYR